MGLDTFSRFICRFYTIAKGSSRKVALPTYLRALLFFLFFFFKKGLRFAPFICIAVACLHCFYVFRASILIFSFSFSHLRSLSFPSSFENFYLANLSKMIPASICQVRVTLELQV